MLRRILSILALLIFCLFAAESAAWVLFYWIKPKPKILQYDPHLGWANRGNLDLMRTRKDGGVWDVRTDSNGMRILVDQKNKAQQKILVLGDSFAFGDSVGSEQHFLYHLSNDYQFLNTGVVGYATDQQLLKLKSYPGEIDALVLMSYLSNDLRDNLSHFERGGLRFKPKYVFDGDLPVLQEVSQPALSWLRSKSYLSTIAFGLLFKTKPTLAIFDSPTVNFMGEEAVEQYRRLLHLIFLEARNKGAKKVLVMMWTHASKGSDGIASRISEEFDGSNSAMPISVIDLDREFQQRSESPSSLYFTLDVDPGGHWNAEGHQVLQELIKQWLN